MRLFGFFLLSVAVCANAASAQILASSETNEATAKSDFTAASDYVTNTGLLVRVLFAVKSQTRVTERAELKNTRAEDVSVSMHAAMALGENPGSEASRKITKIPISFPLVPLEGK